MPEPKAAGWLTMPADLAAALAEHSPRLYIDRPTLVMVPGSDSGWLLVIPRKETQCLST